MEDNIIDKYYSYLGKKAFVTNNIINLFKIKKNTIILSNSYLMRGLGKILKKPVKLLNTEKNIAEYSLAFLDSLEVLKKKHISILFINRVGRKKNNYSYDLRACYRMKHNVSFPKMLIKYDKYESDFKELIGNDCTKKYVEKLSKIPQIIRKGNIYCHEDFNSEYINVINGYRITKDCPQESLNNIHIYGRCGVFGYAVRDEECFPNQLQKILNINNKHLSVINHGLWGGGDKEIFNNFFFELSSFYDGDMVIFYMKHMEREFIQQLVKLGVYYVDITDEWHQYPEAKYCFYDRPGHMNSVGYKNVAKIVYSELEKYHNISDDKYEIKQNDVNHYMAYLKKYGNVDFSNEIKKYIDSIIQIIPKNFKTQKCGSIVMNCNPFTKGHRYLVEYASNIVDQLYIFVVEENKSFFSFEDRFDMVKRGTADIENVIVIPSGRFIISTITFPEYFLKDYVKEKNFDVSGDLETFAQYIAPALNISIRFAGSEPFDAVTLNYNEHMKDILPRYGIDFIEIPRKTVNNSNEIISATKVRQLIKSKELSKLSEYLPESSIEIIKQRYI